MQVSKFELYASFWTPMMYQNQGSESYIFLTIERTWEIMPVNCTKYKTQKKKTKEIQKKGERNQAKKNPNKERGREERTKMENF